MVVYELCKLTEFLNSVWVFYLARGWSRVGLDTSYEICVIHIMHGRVPYPHQNNPLLPPFVPNQPSQSPKRLHLIPTLNLPLISWGSTKGAVFDHTTCTRNIKEPLLAVGRVAKPTKLQVCN